MQLILRRTLEEILEHNRRTTEKPELLRILNVVSPRSWRFSFSFNSRQETELQISCDPPLSESDFITIADGSIPELFNARSIAFASDDETAIEGEIAFTRNNIIAMERAPATNHPVGIRLQDYMLGPLPPSFSHPSIISEYIHSETWFGSEFLSREHKGKKCEWSVFGDLFIVKPQSWASELESNPIFRQELDFECMESCGRYYVVALNRSPRNYFLRHSRLGPLPIIEDLPNKVANALRSCAIMVEIHEPGLTYESNGEIGPISMVRAIEKTLATVTEQVLRSEAYESFQSEIESEKARKAAEALRNRQENARNRPLLYLHDNLIGHIPRSENEIMMLLAKLEATDGLPLALFHLVEYTPQSGIDALADLQMEDTGMTQPLAPIELELHFENFIKHGHPIQQVALIVCWDFQSESTIDRLKLAKSEDWLYQYTTADGSCPILVLSELPGIIQRDH